jgi:hypothetical protein
MIVKEIEKNTKMIRIHNVYNSSLISYTSKNNLFTLSKIMQFIVKTFDDHHILLKKFDKRFIRHNAKSQSHFDFIKKFDYVKNSQFDQHYKFHVHDDLFNEKIKTLHDTFRFRSIVESHSYLDKNFLRHEIELFANCTQNMKIYWFEQNQKSDETRVHVTIFDHNSRNQHLR